MKHTSLFAALLCCSGVAWAKLPAPDDAAKAKAAETAAKTAWQGKVDAFQLCKAQDRVAARYRAKNAAAASPGATGPTPCADPGPFAYNPPAQTPLETSGAHSPAGTATKPPSVNQPAAETAPAKKS